MTPLGGTAARVLVADDDPLIRMVLRSALEEHGVEVAEAASGAEAIAAAHTVDLAVVDARMPGLSLLETIVGLRSQRRIPVLVISGAWLDDNLPDDVAYLMKPIELADFLSAVDRLLEVSTVHRGDKAAL